jgi:ATP-binding cassette subfamily F protein 3
MLVGLQHVDFEFGARSIVSDATWHIQPLERIGLIGFNGTGKSTLLKLLTGEYSPTGGTVDRGRNTSIGYLHQDLLSFDSNDSILTVAMGAFHQILRLEKEIEMLGLRLGENQSDVALLQQYSDTLHEMDLLDGYSIHHRTEEVLHGLGFSIDDLQRPYREFSGGWRMRVLLAKMILQQPDLLLLDEPTNHLDLPSIEWLEKYLQHYPGAVVIVSHDKYFLNRMVTKIVELYQESLHFYNGNYSFYESEKLQRLDIQQRAYENQQDYIRQQERFIERFKAKASKAAAAQSAMKRLGKLDRIEEAALERPSIRINFRMDKTPGKILVSLREASKSFGSIRIVENASAEVDRGDKIALIGANGTGKSTLLRMIAGLEPFIGERIWGHQVDQSMYAQHQLDSLNLDHTVLEEMALCGSRKTELELRTLLGCFLFSGDDVEKKIRILSGGEKARVALAKTIVSQANFLLLDEPTNHLDMHSCDLLIDALEKYPGSYVLVSHDRYFISKTANKIWEIADGRICEFKGPYEEWVAWKQRMALKVDLAPVPAAEPPAPPDKPESAAPGKGAINKEIKKELQKQQRLFQDLETQVDGLKNKLKGLEAALTDPGVYADKGRFLRAESEYEQARQALAKANHQFELAFEKVVDLEKQLTQ